MPTQEQDPSVAKQAHLPGLSEELGEVDVKLKLSQLGAYELYCAIGAFLPEDSEPDAGSVLFENKQELRILLEKNRAEAQLAANDLERQTNSDQLSGEENHYYQTMLHIADAMYSRAQSSELKDETSALVALHNYLFIILTADGTI